MFFTVIAIKSILLVIALIVVTQIVKMVLARRIRKLNQKLDRVQWPTFPQRRFFESYAHYLKRYDRYLDDHAKAMADWRSRHVKHTNPH